MPEIYSIFDWPCLFFLVFFFLGREERRDSFIHSISIWFSLAAERQGKRRRGGDGRFDMLENLHWEQRCFKEVDALIACAPASVWPSLDWFWQNFGVFVVVANFIEFGKLSYFGQYLVETFVQIWEHLHSGAVQKRITLVDFEKCNKLSIFHIFFFANIGFHTAENEPSSVCHRLLILTVTMPWFLVYNPTFFPLISQGFPRGPGIEIMSASGQGSRALVCFEYCRES